MTNEPFTGRKGASRTAIGVAALRAAHQIFDAEPRILEDPIAERLLDDDTRERMRAHPERLATPLVAVLRTHVVVRSRFAEDRLAEAVATGVRQYILLGAGLDTFAYRQPAWASALRIVEVDQPASQADKQARLARAGIRVPDNVTFAPIDFETTPLADGLAAAGVQLGVPTFVAWLGVMMYLTREASEAVFRVVRGLPPSSEIVFTFSPAPDEATGGQGSRLAGYVAELGEPFRMHISPDELVAWLRALGFARVDLLTPEAIETRYLAGRTDGLRVSRRTTIASARV
jgi:methyltransferase (TIGR00027 family)